MRVNLLDVELEHKKDMLAALRKLTILWEIEKRRCFNSDKGQNRDEKQGIKSFWIQASPYCWHQESDSRGDKHTEKLKKDFLNSDNRMCKEINVQKENAKIWEVHVADNGWEKVECLSVWN